MAKATPTKFTSSKAAGADKAPKAATTSKADREAKANAAIAPPVEGELGATQETSDEADRLQASGLVSKRDINNSRQAIDAQRAAEHEAAMRALHTERDQLPGMLQVEATHERTVWLVTVKRGLETIPTEILPHELDILRRLHLPENVQVVDKEYGVLDLPDSARVELLRLQSKYGITGRKIVDTLFPSVEAVAQAVKLRNDEYDTIASGDAVQVDNRRKPKAK